MFNNLFCQQYIENMHDEGEGKKENKKDIQKDTLQPITKVNTKLDKELQEWEVDSTTSGGWAGRLSPAKRATNSCVLLSLEHAQFCLKLCACCLGAPHTHSLTLQLELLFFAC